MVTENEEDDVERERGEVYEIEIDDGGDADEAMREAMEAVAARERGGDDEPEPLVDPADERSGADLAKEMQRELEELRERSIRTLADYENFRRRVDRERADQRRYAAAEALTGFLEVVDNLERALQAEGPADDLRKGVEMIHRQMLDLLDRFGASPIEALGERFDPSVHEAVSRVEDETVSHPTVLEEYQRGYRMHDRLLRPSMVLVGVPAGREEAAEVEGSGEDAEAEEF